MNSQCQLSTIPAIGLVHVMTRQMTSPANLLQSPDHTLTVPITHHSVSFPSQTSICALSFERHATIATTEPALLSVYHVVIGYCLKPWQPVNCPPSVFVLHMCWMSIAGSGVPAILYSHLLNTYTPHMYICPTVSVYKYILYTRRVPHHECAPPEVFLHIIIAK